MEEPRVNKNGIFYPRLLELKNYSPEHIACIEDVVYNLLKYETNYGKPISLLGKVQSGKTNTFIGVMALGLDNVYDICIILTKSSVTLAEQTLKRVEREFDEFITEDQILAYDIMNMPPLTEYQLSKKLILVVKKEDDNLRKLYETFNEDYEILKQKNTLIIDDEADWASIGFQGKIAELTLSKIALQIKEFRALLNSKSDFLQVTATPYSLYLQPETSIDGYMLRPEKIILMPTYKGYVGGIEYFEESENETSIYHYLKEEFSEDELYVYSSQNARYSNQILTHEKLKGFRRAIVNFIVGSALRNISEKREIRRNPIKFSFIFHIDVSKQLHDWIKTSLIDQLIIQYKDNLELFKKMVWISYEDLITSFKLISSEIPSLEDITVISIELLNFIRVIKVNSDSEIKSYMDSKNGQLKLIDPLNIFVGAFILDRGITIDNLIGFYYGRNPQKFQQDTIMQHLRVYGNRKKEDMAVSRVYSTARIFKALAATHRLDEEMRKAILENDYNRIIAIFKDSGGDIKPTNPNKLKLSKVETVSPRGKLIPTHFNVKKNNRNQESFTKINSILSELIPTRNFELPFLTDNDVIVKILDLIQSTFTFDSEDSYNFDAVKHLIKTISKNQNSFKSYLFVRENRELPRFSPTNLTYITSPDAEDIRTIAYETAETLPVLMLLGQKGEKRTVQKGGENFDIGWEDQPFFWPLLFTPSKMKPFIFENSFKK